MIHVQKNYVHSRTQINKKPGSEHTTWLDKEPYVNTVYWKVFACAKCSSVSRKTQRAPIQRIRVNSYTVLLCKLTMTAAYTERGNAGGSNIRDIWNIRGRPNLEKEQPLNKPTSITSCPGRIFHDYCCCGTGHCSSGWKTVMIKHSLSLPPSPFLSSVVFLNNDYHQQQ